MSGNAGGTAPRGSTGRNVIWLAATTVILVLLLGYRTSTGGAPPAPPTQPPGASTPGPGASGQPDELREEFGASDTVIDQAMMILRRSG